MMKKKKDPTGGHAQSDKVETLVPPASTAEATTQPSMAEAIEGLRDFDITSAPDAGLGDGAQCAMAVPAAGDVAHTLDLADAGDIINRNDMPESTIGGQTTCIVCMIGLKSHIAVPCGHQSVCANCSAKMQLCPYCREPVQLWMQARVV